MQGDRQEGMQHGLREEVRDEVGVVDLQSLTLFLPRRVVFSPASQKL